MMVDPTSRYAEIRVQQLLCQMYSSDFEVTGWDLMPLISLLRIIKEEYSVTKPEVYRTIIAILHDYKPMCGERHREKTLRYLRLLLGCNAELADHLSRVLPPVQTAASQYSHCLLSAQCRPNDNCDVDSNSNGEPLEAVHHADAVFASSSACDDQDQHVTGSKSSGTLQWPIPVRSSRHLTSQKALTKAVSLGVASPERQPAAESSTFAAAASTNGRVIRAKTITVPLGSDSDQPPRLAPPQAGTAIRDRGPKNSTTAVGVKTQPPAALTVARPAVHAMARYLGANIMQPCATLGGPKATPLRCAVTQPARLSGPVARYLILRPVSLASGHQRPANVGITAAADGAPRFQSVHTTVRQPIVPPRVISRPTFAAPAASTNCRVIRAKTITVPRVHCQPPRSDFVQPPTFAPPQAGTRDRDSPLSCVQVMVANAGTAGSTHWITGLENELTDEAPHNSRADFENCNPVQRKPENPVAVENLVAMALTNQGSLSSTKLFHDTEPDVDRDDATQKHDGGAPAAPVSGTQFLCTSANLLSSVTGTTHDHDRDTTGKVQDDDGEVLNLSKSTRLDETDDVVIRLSVSSENAGQIPESNSTDITSCVIRKRPSTTDCHPKKAAKQ